jgi:DNA-binding protein H-NS
MADHDLETLSLKELKQLHKDVLKAIANFEGRKKAEARAKVDAVAKEMGFSLTELLGADSRTGRAPSEAKYRHPEKPDLTWSGRGRKPNWLLEAVSAGTPLEELAAG